MQFLHGGVIGRPSFLASVLRLFSQAGERMQQFRQIAASLSLCRHWLHFDSLIARLMAAVLLSL